MLFRARVRLLKHDRALGLDFLSLRGAIESKIAMQLLLKLSTSSSVVGCNKGIRAGGSGESFLEFTLSQN